MNTKKHPDVFDDSRVSVWVYEEEVSFGIVGEHILLNSFVSDSVVQFEGKKLTEIINSEHENRKYLPGVKFEDNVVAIPDLKEAVKDATALVFVTPHQCQCSYYEDEPCACG